MYKKPSDVTVGLTSKAASLLLFPNQREHAFLEPNITEVTSATSEQKHMYPIRLSITNERRFLKSI